MTENSSSEAQIAKKVFKGKLDLLQDARKPIPCNKKINQDDLIIDPKYLAQNSLYQNQS